MGFKVDISKAALRRLIRQIDGRPVQARLRYDDPELLAQALRRMPSSSLRRRITVA
jgi:hypothetical protein